MKAFRMIWSLALIAVIGLSIAACSSTAGDEYQPILDAHENETVSDQGTSEFSVVDAEELPWEKSWNAKQPEDYTWEDFENLSPSLQIAFQNSFGDEAEFNEWMANAKLMQGTPWNEGGKKVDKYKWSEFEQLSPSQQIAFQSSFDSTEAFDEWMQSALKLDNYTWEAYEALSPEEQMVFKNRFASAESFEEWLNSVRSEAEQMPWEQGEKRPEEYTWEEFEALGPEEQIIFQSSFEEKDGFEKWLIENEPK